MAKIKSNERLKLLTIRGHKFASGEQSPASSVDSIVSSILKLSTESTTMKSLGLLPSDSSFANLDRAKVVICGGRGVKNKKTYELLNELANILPNAAVGGTRGAVDEGYAKYEQQIGQSGKCLTSDIYIGVGVAGALQHIAGIVDVKTIIAINTDPEANIIKVH